MAWQHDIAGGNGNLVVTSLKSPNFVHGSTGWAINRDGSAEFHAIIIPSGSGGTVVTFAASPPGSPNVGDVWYDTSNGLLAHVWNGSSWAPFTIGGGAIGSGAIGTGNIASAAITNALLAAAAVGTGNIASGAVTATQIAAAAGILGTQIASATISGSNISAATITGGLIAANAITTGLIAAGAVTATQIAANTITAAKLAAGIIYAGIVDGTTISGAQFIAHGASGEILVYSGTPALGNLVASVSAAAGTDAQGNAYQAGTVLYGPDGSTVRLQNQVVSGLLEAGVWMGTGDTHESTSGHLVSVIIGSGGTTQLITALLSPKVSAQAHPGDGSIIEMISWTGDGTTQGPQITMTTTKNAATTGAINIGDSGIIFTGPLFSNSGTASSPTQITTDTEHSLGSPSITNTTVNQGRYKLTPHNETRVDIALTATGAVAAGVYAFANALTAAYQFPGNYSRSYAVGFNGSITTATNNADLLIDGAGTANPGRVRLQIPALPVGTSITVTCFIPLD